MTLNRLSGHQEMQPPPSESPPLPLVPAQRLLHGDQAGLDYFNLVVNSTAEEHGAAVEAVVQVAIAKRIGRQVATSDYLKPTRAKPEGGNPRFVMKSGTWREADRAYSAAIECLAAALGVQYPDRETGSSRWAYREAMALVDKRTGPLCTGFRVDLGSPLQHHPEEPCPLCSKP